MEDIFTDVVPNMNYLVVGVLVRSWSTNWPHCKQKNVVTVTERTCITIMVNWLVSRCLSL